MSPRPEDRHETPTAMAEEIEAWLADVRYRAELDQALGDARRSLAGLAVEHAGRLLERGMIAEGMLWRARALENVPPEAADLDRAVRASLGGWHAGPRAVERTLSHRDAVHAIAFSPDGRRLTTASADASARCWRVPAPVAGDVERIACWVRATTGREIDEGDAIRPIEPAALWELRRLLQDLGGPPVRETK